jgi:hypothetical protein
MQDLCKQVSLANGSDNNLASNPLPSQRLGMIGMHLCYDTLVVWSVARNLAKLKTNFSELLKKMKFGLATLLLDELMQPPKAIPVYPEF